MEIQSNQVIVRVTISLGLICVGPDQELPLDDLIQDADQAMYTAKQQGRNRTVVGTKPEPSKDQEQAH